MKFSGVFVLFLLFCWMILLEYWNGLGWLQSSCNRYFRSKASSLLIFLTFFPWILRAILQNHLRIVKWRAFKLAINVDDIFLESLWDQFEISNAFFATFLPISSEKVSVCRKNFSLKRSLRAFLTRL